eukprot:scaffold22070_cov70-Phaeocystis_antarctica.AAC.4
MHTHPTQKVASSTPIVHALQLIAELVQAAGRPACKLALRAMQPQINYVLHGDPLAEPHDYDDPACAFGGSNDPRYCMTADDLRKMDDGRAAEWAAAQSPAQVAPTCTCACACACACACTRACTYAPRAAPSP